MSAMPIRRTRCVQSRFFLADLRDAFFILAFFFSVVRFLEATFFATFFFVRELGAPIAVATLSRTTPGAAATAVPGFVPAARQEGGSGCIGDTGYRTIIRQAL